MSVPIPIRGPLAVPFRLFGISQSKMNPSICTICERAFRRVKKHRRAALAPGLTAVAATRTLALKGIKHPVLARALIAGGR